MNASRSSSSSIAINSEYSSNSLESSSGCCTQITKKVANSHSHGMLTTEPKFVFIGASHAKKLAEKSVFNTYIRRTQLKHTDIASIDCELMEISKKYSIASILIFAGNNLYPGRFEHDKSKQYVINNYDYKKVTKLIKRICSVSTKYCNKTFFVESPPRGYKIETNLPWFNYYSCNFKERYRFIIADIGEIAKIVPWTNSLSAILKTSLEVIEPIFESRKGEIAILNNLYCDSTHLMQDEYEKWSKFLMYVAMFDRLDGFHSTMDVSGMFGRNVDSPHEGRN